MLSRKCVLLSQLLLFSLLLHAIVLLFLLAFYSGYRYSTKLVVKRKTVELLPMNVRRVSTITSIEPTSAKISGKPVQQKPVTKSLTTIKSEPVKKKVQSKKNSVSKKNVPPPKPKPKTKDLSKKSKKQKKVAEKKPVAKKEVPQKKQKTIESKRVHKKCDKEKEIVKQNSSVAQSKNASRSSVGQSREIPATRNNGDFDTPRIQSYIQTEISKIWEPPIGLSEGLVCDVTICVGRDGLVNDSKVDQSSGVLMFDLSARTAASSLSLPRWAWGKEFTICFNQ